MSEAAVEINRTEQAVDRIAQAVAEKLAESIPQITAATAASGQQSSVTLKIALAPDKELPDVYHVAITEKLALASVPIDASARIERGKRGPQLSLMAYFSEA